MVSENISGEERGAAELYGWLQGSGLILRGPWMRSREKSELWKTISGYANQE
jgi:hypothetical protein